MPFFDIDQLDEGQDFSDLQFDNGFDDNGSSGWEGLQSASLTSGSEESPSDVRAYETDADM